MKLSPGTQITIALAALLFSATATRAADPKVREVAERVLKAADKNKDGKLDFAEYAPLDMQAEHHGDRHFALQDADKDGFLNANELGAALMKKQMWFPILVEGAKACFARLDVDKNGKLDLAEYGKLENLSHHADQHFKASDTNRDGFVVLAEFEAYAEGNLKALAEGKTPPDFHVGKGKK